MDYATAYDVGERKRHSGINEDSVAFCLFEDGHRDGLVHSAGRVPDESSPASSDQATPAETAPSTAASTDAAEEDAADELPDDLESLLARSASNLSPEDDDADPEETEQSDADDEDTDANDEAANADRPNSPEPTPDQSESQPTNRSVAVFALADGAGGYDAGDVASYIATTVVVEELAPLAVRAARSDPDAFDVDLTEPLPETPTTATFQGAIADAIQIAHRKILQYAEAAGQPSFTTIVAGLAVDGELHYGWVGDSRAYVVATETGHIEQLTRDHSVVANLRDAGAIDEVEAHVHPRGNEITDAMGGHPGADVESATVGVETHTVPLWNDDVIMVTSDGLIDAQTDAPSLHDRYVAADGSEAVKERIREAVVTDDELRDGVLTAATLDDATGELIDLANDRGGKDNLSLLLFRDPTLPDSPSPDVTPTRAINPDEPLEDRQTIIIPDE